VLVRGLAAAVARHTVGGGGRQACERCDTIQFSIHYLNRFFGNIILTHLNIIQPQRSAAEAEANAAMKFSIE
jgi:hypothetical protein